LLFLSSSIQHPKKMIRKTKIYNVWLSIHSSFWFIPAAMIVVSFIFSIFSLFIDHYFYTRDLFLSIDRNSSSFIEYFFYVGPEGARAVLTTISGSMISVAGVTFSITIVALTMAAAQFGSRLLRNFMQDKSTQSVLGVFLSTYIYCVLILRSIQSHYDNYFVPVLSVNCAVIMAIFSVGVLIFFIHHISVSIQAEYVLSSVYEQLKVNVERIIKEMSVYEDREKTLNEDDPLKFDLALSAYPVEDPLHSTTDGYLQAIDYDKMIDIARQHDIIIKLEAGPGDYSTTGVMLARIKSRGFIKEEVFDQLAATFIFGNQRTPEQDIEFGVHQIVEVAVRSLSPGINDPFTAISCIDSLSSIVCILAKNHSLPTSCNDPDGNLRLIIKPLRFGDLLDSAFNQIRQNSHSSVAVTISLMGAFRRIAEVLKDAGQKKELHRHADMLFHQRKNTITVQNDVDDFKKRYDACLAYLHS